MRRCGNCHLRHWKDIREGGNLTCLKTREDVSLEGVCEDHTYYRETMATMKERRVMGNGPTRR